MQNNILYGKDMSNESEGESLMIAEAGINHNGVVEKALKLVDMAARAGSDVVKFASFNSDELMTNNAVSSSYIEDASHEGENFLDLAKRHELNFDEQRRVIAHCKEKGIHFLSTPFDEGSLDFLVDSGVKAVKIASGDLTNLPYLKIVAARSLPVIVSTGMATYGEIEQALATLRGANAESIFLMHCVSWYPADIKDMNIKVLETLSHMFDVPVGLSDHSLGINASLAARARGCKFFEKHITLDRNDFGPDHNASMDEAQLTSLISGFRDIELCLGDGVKRILPIEYEQRKVHRRSVVAVQDIAVGEEISMDMIRLKRPGTGIEPKHFDKIVGLKPVQKVNAGDTLQWNILKY